MNKIPQPKIMGIDEKRPPKLRKEPYIDLFFQLSEQAPELWCENFNKLTQTITFKTSIDKSQGLFIETYVRDIHKITEHLGILKQMVKTCNEQYAESLHQQELAEDKKNASLLGESGQQGQLNAIIAALNFADE